MPCNTGWSRTAAEVDSGTTGGLVAAGTGGLIVVYIGCAFWYSALVASIAEMLVNSYLTKQSKTEEADALQGGQYHWSSEFAHPKAQKFISYLAGWLLTTSWLVGIASGLFLAGQLAQACIAIANPGFVPAAWQVWLFVLMFAIAAGLANTVLAQYLALLEIMAAGLYAIAFAANLIVLWVMAPKNTSSEVFGSFVNGAGWNNNGFGILTAQLSVLFLLIGSDGAAHMSEEIQDASLSVPRGIWGSYLLGAVTGFVMLVTFCFTFTENAANTTIGFPFIQVYLDATGSVGGAQALTAVLILLIFFGAANFMASASRQTFAFARDGGLPFSRQISKVNDRFGVPLVAVGVACTVPVLLSLIDLGSTVAFEAVSRVRIRRLAVTAADGGYALLQIVSLQFIALFFTYLVSIGTLIYRRLYGPPLPERRWSLGRLGLTINIIALLYGLFALAFVVIPSVPSPTLEEMNWVRASRAA
ncbi:hypothetical protein LTR82_017753 [Friedmanniomyces endolithicus]|uniref:Uncharacterized protein n=1 Tax=Friedmanniomyces endolithicus TaxID=329885 RepID=A0AAN6F7E2_9PEZI|nr:hypothetical protein LTR82_017753 [Friedmanniomyces endolithicus]